MEADLREKGRSMRSQISKKQWILLAFGSAVMFIALGTRHSFGLFLPPVTSSLPDISRESFGFAIALQNLIWGIGQPFAGMAADRYGSARVIFVGGLLYAAGLYLASSTTASLGLQLSLGVLVGIGLSCTSFAVVLGAVGRHFPAERRSTALAIASVGGSMGIFLSVPIALSLIGNLGWSIAFVVLAGVATVMCIAAPRLAGKAEAARGEQSLSEAIREAANHRGFVLLLAGFFVCGFQLAFIGTHLPAYLLDQGLALWVGGAALALIGAANVVGTLACGILGDHFSKKNTLALLYLVRAGATVLFLLLPISPMTTLVYGVAMGFTWLGTVPLTSGIVGQVFGPRYLSSLVGIVFLMHQVGSFLGAWLGGMAFERTGSYDLVWWSVAVLGVVAALLHWPIDERPINDTRAGAPLRGAAS